MIKPQDFVIVQNKRKIGWCDFNKKKIIVQIEKGEITILEDISKEIWDLCQKPTSLSDIMKYLKECFPEVKPAVIRRDTSIFLKDLIKKKLLVLV